ncbi:MAG: transketolase [Acidobacteria bacterium]|nr:transketolase [Acidobacteriota bacterium]
MRDAFAKELTDLAGQDDRIVLLSGDIGNRMFDDFKGRFPDRFFNCGVAEANMTSVAAGMAMCGLRPVTYTIASFNTVRCLEQIRLDVCYHRLPVLIAGVGGGLSYAENCASHLSCEDIAMLRVIPNMTVICPGDVHEVRGALRAALLHDGPVYLRLGKKGEPAVHSSEPPFVIGKGIVIRQGQEVCLLSTGNVLPLAVRSADALEALGISTQVVSCHTVKPLDHDLLAEAFSRFRLVATLEEHSVLGGLGGSVAEWVTDHEPSRAVLLRCGTADAFPPGAGHQEYMRQIHGLVPGDIVRRVQQLLKASVSAR